VSRLILAILVAAIMLGPLAGCGRRGDPEVPKGDKDTLNQHYPKPEPDQH